MVDFADKDHCENYADDAQHIQVAGRRITQRS